MSLWSEDDLETRKTGLPAQLSRYLVDPVRNCRDTARSQLGVEHQSDHTTLRLICLSFDLHEMTTKLFPSGLKIFFFDVPAGKTKRGTHSIQFCLIFSALLLDRREPSWIISEKDAASN